MVVQRLTNCIFTIFISTGLIFEMYSDTFFVASSCYNVLNNFREE